MKFGKRLELSLHPLWREKYVSYKKLKRILKRIEYCLQQRKGDKGGGGLGIINALVELIKEQYNKNTSDK